MENVEQETMLQIIHYSKNFNKFFTLKEEHFTKEFLPLESHKWITLSFNFSTRWLSNHHPNWAQCGKIWALATLKLPTIQEAILLGFVLTLDIFITSGHYF